MKDSTVPQAANDNDGAVVRPEDVGHPRGTLAIVVLYGILFAIGWLVLYLLEFLPRG